jgi:hypothetical protein
MSPEPSMAALPIQRWFVSGAKLACSLTAKEPEGRERRSS